MFVAVKLIIRLRSCYIWKIILPNLTYNIFRQTGVVNVVMTRDVNRIEEQRVHTSDIIPQIKPTVARISGSDVSRYQKSMPNWNKMLREKTFLRQTVHLRIALREHTREPRGCARRMRGTCART